MKREEFFSAEKPEGKGEIEEIKERRFIRDASRFVYLDAADYLREYSEAAPPDTKEDIQGTMNFLSGLGWGDIESRVLRDLENKDNTLAISLLALFRSKMRLVARSPELQEEESYETQKNVVAGADIFDEQIKGVIDRLVSQSPLFADLGAASEEQQKRWAERARGILEIVGKSQVLSQRRIDEYLNLENIIAGNADPRDIEDFKNLLIQRIEVGLPVATTSFVEYLAGKFLKEDLVKDIKELMELTDIVSALDRRGRRAG